jgi:hypothetical protein
LGSTDFRVINPARHARRSRACARRREASRGSLRPWHKAPNSTIEADFLPALPICYEKTRPQGPIASVVVPALAVAGRGIEKRPLNTTYEFELD